MKNIKKKAALIGIWGVHGLALLFAYFFMQKEVENYSPLGFSIPDSVLWMQYSFYCLTSTVVVYYLFASFRKQKKEPTDNETLLIPSLIVLLIEAGSFAVSILVYPFWILLNAF